MPRAGWAGGMLRAPKLYQSVSISGPSATSNPIPTKTSSSASRVWDTRWRWPRRRGPGGGAGHELGQVEPGGGHLGGAARRSGSRPGALEQRLDRGPGLVQLPAQLLPGLGVHRAERAGRLGQRPTSCPSTAAATWRISSVRRRRRRWPLRRLGHQGRRRPPRRSPRVRPAVVRVRAAAVVHGRHRRAGRADPPVPAPPAAGGAPRSTARRPTRPR